MTAVLLALLLTAQLPPGPPLPLGAGPEVHGERDAFSAGGVRLAWAVLRAPVEEDTQVVIRIALSESPYYYVRMYGVDPFSGERRLLAPGDHAHQTVDLRTPRHTFAGFPRREIRLYRTDEEWKADVPALTIFYLGAPDTTPEFLSEPALAAYLDRAVGRVTR